MAVMMIMRWENVSLEQYDEVKKVVGWEETPPEGGVLHVTAHDGTALRITDVWESAEAFEAFVNDRLMPGVASVGIEGQPEVEILPLHDQFTPGL
jgi:hypothetical protein